MSKRIYVISAVISMLLMGCAPQKVPKAYYSQPEIQKASNSAFDVQIEPEKLDNPFYVAFMLTLRNKTTDALAINWDRTRYLHRGEDLGIFVFKGIDPESVKNGIPKEIVPVGKTLVKRISPYRLLAFRFRENVRPGQSSFFPGILPGGSNTILLVVEQGDQVWRESLSVLYRPISILCKPQSLAISSAQFYLSKAWLVNVHLLKQIIDRYTA